MAVHAWLSALLLIISGWGAIQAPDAVAAEAPAGLLVFADGTTGHTHTHDAHEHVPAGDGDRVMAPGKAIVYPPVVPPVCVSNPSNQYHTQVIYALAGGRPDRSSSLVPEMKMHIAQANGRLREEAAPFGVQLDFRFRCSGSDIHVEHVALPTYASSPSFTTVVNDLKALGYTSSYAKYWIYFDGPRGDKTFCGQSVMKNQDDDSLSVSNPNNVGPHYAISWDCPKWSVWLHEGAHALGAVQRTAPHTSSGPTENGRHHCNDGRDIMCYDDGGQKADYTTQVCPTHRRPFDCGKDDYFHPKPQPGNYLYDHWNLGSPLVRFTDYIDNVPSQPRNVEVTGGAASRTVAWDAPQTTHGSIVRYHVWASDEVEPFRLVGQTTSQSFTHAVPEGTYPWVYKVTAVNANGEGDWSEPATTSSPPGIPAIWWVRTDPGFVTVNWLGPFDDGGSPVSYFELKKHVPSVGYVLLTEMDGRNYRDDDCDLGDVCWYTVAAVNAAGRGLTSAPTPTP